jgi:predicted nucleic acid-binding protein
VTLTDAGPLIALIDAGESDHERCRDALAALQLPLVSTWPTFTEAIYLLGRAAGWPGQDALWRMLQRGALNLASLDAEQTARSAALMRRYSDHPMDLADATLVALAESRELSTIFTLDSHFRTYSLRGGRHLTVIPQ